MAFAIFIFMSRSHFTRASLLHTALALVLSTDGQAQATRTVREPVIPAACAVLTAALTSVGDTPLADVDERRLDTERI